MTKGNIVEIVNTLSTHKNISLIKKVLRQHLYFSTRLQYANKKIREVYYYRVNTTYNSSEDMIQRLQELKGKTKLKFHDIEVIIMMR